jgi:glycosyltransferase involved in cell wall biosynthesis
MASALLAEPEIRSQSTSRALHLVQGVLSLDLGGLERVAVDLVAEQVRRGNRATVICVDRPGKLAPQVEAMGGQVFSLNRLFGQSHDVRGAAEDLLRRLQPNILHTHQIGALWHLGQAARELQVPVVHTEHSDHVAMARGWYSKLRARYWWRRAGEFADRFCCVSEDVARSVTRWGTVAKQRTAVIANGINTGAFAGEDLAGEIRESLGIPAGALVLGSVGRLVEVKRYDWLLRAFARLCSLGRQTNIWLLLVGDGPERARLESLAVRLGIQKRVVFAGYQSQPQRCYSAMDLFVLTSRHEGLPLALLEAWAAKLPVVASAVGGIPRAVTHGVTGMLFPPRDFESLVDTLVGLLETPAWMRLLAHNGRQLAEKQYSLASMADAYESQYSPLVTQRGQSS